MGSLLQKSKKNRRSFQDAKSTKFPNKPFLESVASCPVPKNKENSSLCGIINAFGGCFMFSKKKHEDTDISSQDASASSSNDGTYKSVGSSFSLSSNSEGTSGVIFTMDDLISATCNFSPSLKIGHGGFGTVYKGRLKDGRFVAVKRAKKNANDKQVSAEFRNEFATLSNVDHLNLVKFIGYLEEQHEHILVVEYVANGNLRQHLDGHYGKVLDLATRLDIAIDIAHALTYLHFYADRSIIHRDIKSSNILLTENFRAKVADFGFSRLGPWEVNATHVSTQVKGTAGYLDPEYLRTYQLTQKSDVYSFGVLLVELFTGRRPIEPKRDVKERITGKWAYQMFLDGKAVETLDPKLERSSSAYLMIEKLLELAFECAAPTRKERPRMKKAAEALWDIRKDFHSLWQVRPVCVLKTLDSQSNNKK